MESSPYTISRIKGGESNADIIYNPCFFRRASYEKL